MATLTLSSNKVDIQESLQIPADMKCVASVILGGGEGTRLYPLTLTRCKPAVNFGGKYCLIDVPISHSIHANCSKTFVLTQYLSSSLHHHILNTYMQGGKAANSIEILAAEQKPMQKTWYEGTADAVRQNIHYLLESPVDYFLILSGDQLYNLNLKKMLAFAQQTDADVVIAAQPVNAQEAGRMGILKINNKNMITEFHEKPQEAELLNKLRSPAEVLERAGIPSSSKRMYLGSMGIYLFKRKVLADLLLSDGREDFGKHLIPELVKQGRTAAFLYEGYWEDVGTIETFYQANIALTMPNPQFNLHNEERPLFAQTYDLPPARFSDTQIKQSILCEGAIIEADEIKNSILGPRTVVQKGSIIRNSYIMGNDHYEAALKEDHHITVPTHIGENCLMTRTIVDKNVSIGRDVKLINKQQLTHYNGENIFIRDGIIIVPKGAVIPDGFVL